MKHIVLLSLLAGAAPLFAELTVDPIYQSHMVLQQGAKMPICGTATGTDAVTVTFGDQQVKAQVKDKKWCAMLQPLKADAQGKPLRVTQGNETVELEDVLVGEVWLASGQSNMFWRLVETRDQEALAAPENPGFRFYHAEPQIHTRPNPYTDELRRKLRAGEMYQGGWSVSSPENSRRMSAVGWYFGKKLQETLGVPVGVIHVSLGGSEMMAWLPKQVIAEKHKECLDKDWMFSPYMDGFWVRRRVLQNLGDDRETPHPYNPGYLFETGIRPWVNFPIAGVIWYQGETDAESQPDERNARVLKDLINSWRAEFKRPNMPFYMVQLPRIKDMTATRAYWPEFREVQRAVSRSMQHVSYVVTLDLGTTSSDVHPPRKIEVGQRMANMAAAEVYGKSDIPYSGPIFKAAVLKNDKIVVSYEHATGLKTTDGKAPACFEVSADGTHYAPAAASLAGDKVELQCQAIAKPKYVRYAWASFVNPNLVNAAGLPAEPFKAELASH